MTSLSSNNQRSLLFRPYWLVLALVLFFAGQIASSAHWHDIGNQLDADCALCMLSGANGAALTTSTWQPLSIPLGAPLVLIIAAVVRCAATPCYDSRAPPFHS